MKRVPFWLGVVAVAGVVAGAYVALLTIGIERGLD